MLENHIWKKILSQTNIFNIFPSRVPYHTVVKIIQSNCRQTKKKYVPACSMWLKRIFANTDEGHWLTISCSSENKNGPGRSRTQADDPEKQVCYFNKPCNDELFNVFISNRIKTENFSSSIYFKIDRVQGKDKTIDVESLMGEEELENEDMKKLLSTLTERLESQLDPDFFQDDNDVKKKQKQQQNIVIQK